MPYVKLSYSHLVGTCVLLSSWEVSFFSSQRERERKKEKKKVALYEKNGKVPRLILYKGKKGLGTTSGLP